LPLEETINGSKNLERFMTRGLQLPKVRGTNLNFDNKILANTDLVKQKYQVG
jgi:hypothetical protein